MIFFPADNETHSSPLGVAISTVCEKGESSEYERSLPFFQTISTRILPLAFSPVIRPDFNAVGKAGKRWIFPFSHCKSSWAIPAQTPFVNTPIFTLKTIVNIWMTFCLCGKTFARFLHNCGKTVGKNPIFCFFTYFYLFLSIKFYKKNNSNIHINMYIV